MSFPKNFVLNNCSVDDIFHPDTFEQKPHVSQTSDFDTLDRAIQSFILNDCSVNDFEQKPHVSQILTNILDRVAQESKAHKSMDNTQPVKNCAERDSPKRNVKTDAFDQKPHVSQFLTNILESKSHNKSMDEITKSYAEHVKRDQKRNVKTEASVGVQGNTGPVFQSIPTHGLPVGASSMKLNVANDAKQSKYVVDALVHGFDKDSIKVTLDPALGRRYLLKIVCDKQVEPGLFYLVDEIPRHLERFVELEYIKDPKRESTMNINNGILHIEIPYSQSMLRGETLSFDKSVQ